MFKIGRVKRRFFGKRFKNLGSRRSGGTGQSGNLDGQSLISDVETMMVSSSGGRKGTKMSQIGFIDPVALYELGKVAGLGIEKYDKYNYLNGYDWSLSYNACMRHLQQMWSGEDYDEESGLLHATHAAWHALALTSFTVRKIGTDDRFKGCL